MTATKLTVRGAILPPAISLSVPLSAFLSDGFLHLDWNLRQIDRVIRWPTFRRTLAIDLGGASNGFLNRSAHSPFLAISFTWPAVTRALRPGLSRGASKMEGRHRGFSGNGADCEGRTASSNRHKPARPARCQPSAKLCRCGSADMSKSTGRRLSSISSFTGPATLLPSFAIQRTKQRTPGEDRASSGTRA